MPLCLAAGAVAATIAAETFTLAWTHSIEKIRWEEDWRVAGAALVLDEARIRGSGAGMEPPSGARLANGVWHYRPERPPLSEVALSHSPHAGHHELCLGGHCRPLADYLPAIDNHAVITLRSCP